MRHTRALIASISATVILQGCGSETPEASEGEDTPKSETSTPTTTASSPEPTKSPSPTPSPTPTEEPEPEAPEPAAPSFGERDEVRDTIDDLVDEDIEWDEAPTPRGRERLLGLVDGTVATIELFGPDDAINEIAYQVVFDGTSQDANFDRALPMITMSQEFASEKSAMFVGSRLDAFTRSPQMPATNRTQKSGDVFVRVLSIDVVDAVNLTLSVGKRPTKP